MTGCTSIEDPHFEPFPKIARLSREIVVTEKIDGTNAQVFITDDGRVLAGSRTRWLTPESDNFGFAAWVHANQFNLKQLGQGRHYGEWWGAGSSEVTGSPNGGSACSTWIAGKTGNRIAATSSRSYTEATSIRRR